ncbi:MAG: DUF2277 domain-containing protein [Anaerolineales bacterium]|nr:DUF2277 domain-containing protein [Anaerolineales bacterium]
MCRNIKQLRRFDRSPTDEELADAALQFVRKISGYRKPSKANELVFEQAIDEIVLASRKMFDGLTIRPEARSSETRNG